MGARTTRCCGLTAPTRIGWKSFGIEEVVIELDVVGHKLTWKLVLEAFL